MKLLSKEDKLGIFLGFVVVLVVGIVMSGFHYHRYGAGRVEVPPDPPKPKQTAEAPPPPAPPPNETPAAPPPNSNVVITYAPAPPPPETKPPAVGEPLLKMHPYAETPDGECTIYLPTTQMNNYMRDVAVMKCKNGQVAMTRR